MKVKWQRLVVLAACIVFLLYVLGKMTKPGHRDRTRRRRRHSRTRSVNSKQRRGGSRNGVEAFEEDAPFKFAVMAMFKNEAMVIREWVEHYKWQGADFILLLNNDSTDNFKDKLAGTEDIVTVLDAPGRHKQEEYYNTIGKEWLKEKNADIVAVVDIDEYLFAKDGKPLKEHLRRIFMGPDPPGKISCPWSMFGSSGHITQPSSIRSSFIKRKSGTEKLRKSIFRLNALKRVDIHLSDVEGRSDDCPEEFQLNHYAIMSKEYFEKVKMVRGDAYQAVTNTIRNWDYFAKYDHKDEEDTQLKNLIENI